MANRMEWLADVIANVADGIATEGSMAYKSTLEEARPSKTSWWHPKTETTIPKRVASYIGISVTGWNAMKSI